MFNTKKQYFKNMLKDAHKVIWDLEFKKFTALNERESVRRQYDQLQDALSRINVALESNPKNEKALADKDNIEKDIKDTKAYMDSIEGTITGSNPTALLPDGAEGIDNNLRKWVQRRDYIDSFIKLNT